MRHPSVTPSPPSTGTPRGGGSEYRLLNNFLHSNVISRSRTVELPPRLTAATGTRDGHIRRIRRRAERNAPFTGFESPCTSCPDGWKD